MAEHTDNSAKSTQERGRTAIATAARQTTGAVEEGVGRMADAGHSAVDIAQQTAAAGAETIRHLGDTAVKQRVAAHSRLRACSRNSPTMWRRISIKA